MSLQHTATPIQPYSNITLPAPSCNLSGITNANFELVDALNMSYPDNSFDLVWGCESGEHMPDKEKYVQEMARVLKPGGRLVIATW